MHMIVFCVMRINNELERTDWYAGQKGNGHWEGKNDRCLVDSVDSGEEQIMTFEKL